MSMNILLCMPLQQGKLKNNQIVPAHLSPCDDFALSCSARLRRQLPDAQLYVILAAVPRESGEAAGILRRAYALGADHVLLAETDDPAHAGTDLLSAAEQYFGTSYSLVLTGFSMYPLLSEETAARHGLPYVRNTADISLDVSCGSPLSGSDRKGASALLQIKKAGQIRTQSCPLPLAAEIVRSAAPLEQPSFAALSASFQLDIPTYRLTEDASASPAQPVRETESLPIRLDTREISPRQAAKELLAILKSRRLLPEGSPETNPVPFPLPQAERIISVGRGAAAPEEEKKETLRMVSRLAAILDASIGSSKAAVDLKILPPELQVGKTSNIVSPDLYLAFGISGSIQHQDGMRNSGFIAAVNSDPDAALFRIADVCVIGDLKEILAALLQEAGDVSADPQPDSAL